METDFDSSFVFNGDPSIPLFPLISGENLGQKSFNPVFPNGEAMNPHHYAFPTTFNSVNFNGDTLTPSFHYYCTPSPSNFPNSFTEDVNYCYSSHPHPPAAAAPFDSTEQQLGSDNSVPKLSPPRQPTKPYDFFSSTTVPQHQLSPPVDPNQTTFDFFSSQNESTTHHSVLNSQTLESVLENFNVNISSANNKNIPKLPKKNMKRSGSGSSSSSTRQERIMNEKVRCLRKVMPWVSTKMSTATLLDEAYRYIKILQSQIKCLIQSRAMPSTSFDRNQINYQQHPNYFVNDGINAGGVGLYGGPNLTREEVMELVWKANMGQNGVDFGLNGGGF